MVQFPLKEKAIVVAFRKHGLSVCLVSCCRRETVRPDHHSDRRHTVSFFPKRGTLWHNAKSWRLTIALGIFGP